MPKLKNIHILLILVVFLQMPTSTTIGQNSLFNNLLITTNYHKGYNLPEYQIFNYYTNSYVQSIDFCISKQSYGKNYWQQLFKYPEYGISFFYSTLGNDNIYGREIALNYFFKVHFLQINKFTLFNRTGIGLSYVSEKFDQYKNPYNTATGSNINMHFNTRMGLSYLLNSKFSLNTGLSFDHFSNANTSEPNLGINYVTAYAGLNYKLGTHTPKQSHTIPKHVKKINYYAFLNFGGKHTRALSSDYFLTSSVAIEAKYELTRSFHIGIGSDLFYDASVQKQLTDLNKKYQNSYDFQSGIHISQTFVYNRISITIQEGLYLILPEKVNNYKMYNRAILQYQINNNICLRMAMKSHLHILDYPEIGIGINF